MKSVIVIFFRNSQDTNPKPIDLSFLHDWVQDRHQRQQAPWGSRRRRPHGFRPPRHLIMLVIRGKSKSDPIQALKMSRKCLYSYLRSSTCPVYVTHFLLVTPPPPAPFVFPLPKLFSLPLFFFEQLLPAAAGFCVDFSVHTSSSN